MDKEFDINYVKNIIEACLLATHDTTINIKQLVALFDNELDDTQMAEILNELKEDYTNRQIELVEVAGGYRIRTKPSVASYLNKLQQIKPARYSRSVMETLAIIAHKQPVTRGEIEAIRGVALGSHVIQTLIARNWIQVVGQKQVPGKPSLFATTTAFLEDMGLNSLNDLALVIEEAENQSSEDMEMQA